MSKYLTLFSIYAFYKSFAAKVARIVLFGILLILLLLSIGQPMLTNTILVFFSFFLANEAFIHFKVMRTKPAVKVTQLESVSLEVAVFPALLDYSGASDSYGVAQNLSDDPEIKFIIEKFGKTFTLFEDHFPKEQMLEKAFQIVKAINGDYIREIDLFIAYLLLTEEKSKLFENNDLKENDIVNMLFWARNKFVPKSEGLSRVEFTGSGVFDFFIFGWNVETKRYSNDYTVKVLSDKYSPIVVGRTKEYEEMLTFLAKGSANNVILVGEPGTGRTTLIDYFTYQSHIGRVPPVLAYKRVFELFADRILSGVNNQGELEARINDLFADLYYSGDSIVFIQNIENIFGGGGLNFDMSGVIFQYLKDARIQIIGTATSSIFKTRLANRDDIKQFFEVERLEEPDQEQALFMLFEKVPQLEEKYGASFTYNAIETSIMLSSSYFVDRYLPGKAIDLLESVVSEVKLSGRSIVEKDDVIKKVEQRTKILIASPTEEEKQTLLHLEDEIHKRVIDQQEAVSAVANSIRRLRSGFSNNKRPISVFLFLGPTGVGKTEMAKALSQVYFGDEKRMIRLDMSEYQTQDSIKKMLGSLPGEAYTPSEFLESVKNNPFSLILLDEFEKAHPQILDVFLQVFDDGRLTDNSGRTIPFTSTIIIATSNAGSEMIRERVQQKIDLQSSKREILDYLQKKGMFRPELLNRFDDIVLFKPLGKEEIRSIARLQLKGILKLQEEKSIYLQFDEKIIEKMSREAFDIEFGARNVRRYIQNNIENSISKLILENKIKKGDRKTLTVDEKGDYTLV